MTDWRHQWRNDGDLDKPTFAENNPVAGCCCSLQESRIWPVRYREGNLACGKCGTLVCPKCLVHSYVGVRCPDCAGLRKLPTFDVSYRDIVKASGVGVGIGVVLGLLFSFFSFVLFRIPFLPWFALIGIGYAVGEGISLSVNRKRGRVLGVIAAFAVMISFGTIVLFSYVGQDLFGLMALAFAVYIAVKRVRP